MRYLRLFLLSVAFFFVVILLFSLLIPSNIKVSRAIDISSSPQNVLSLLHDPVKWAQWYPGADSRKVVYVYGKPKGLVLDKNRDHLLLIDSAWPGGMTALLHRGSSSPIRSSWVLHQETAEQVTLQWVLDLHLKWYPWEKFSSLFFEDIYGSRMEEALQTIKTLSE